MTICQNCTSVVIETSPTFTAISGRSKKYWYAAPYPSSYHWWEGIKTLPWEATPETSKERNILSLFLGSVKTANVNSNLFRKTLFSQCERDTSCQWHKTAHACNGVRSALTILVTTLLYFVLSLRRWLTQLRKCCFFVERNTAQLLRVIPSHESLSLTHFWLAVYL